MTQRHRRRKQIQPLGGLALALVLVLLVLVFAAVNLPSDSTPTSPVTLGSQPAQTEDSTPPSSIATDPPSKILSTATISATGDVLMHGPVIKSGVVTNGNYDFSAIFQYFSRYVTQSDYAVANLETTLAGSNNGYKYAGYPQFNCPDGIIDGLKGTGFDRILTANNHTYDTRSIGLNRTQQVISQKGLPHLGTKQDADAPNYVVQEVNGIRIGMCCYTYETDGEADKKALNGIPIKAADAPLINSFDYFYLDMFYAEMEENLADMKAEGADAVILFIHWGDEYRTKQNATQSAMAQKLCDMGIDVIIGGHPHVVQPVELLTSTKNAEHKTVCLYSMGNCVSNQRIKEMDLKTGHTEDGLLFSVTFTKYVDGTVILSGADLLPIWVDLRTSPTTVYAIIPLDDAIADWKTQFGLTDKTLAQAQASYERTMAIVGSGMTQVNTWLQQLTEKTEAAVTPK